MSSLSSSSSVTATPSNVNLGDYPGQPPPPGKRSSRIPVTPAVLRSIFASSRTTLEERSLSRVAFFRYASQQYCTFAAFTSSVGYGSLVVYRFTGFLLSCVAISLYAARGRAIKSGAALLGVGMV